MTGDDRDRGGVGGGGWWTGGKHGKGLEEMREREEHAARPNTSTHEKSLRHV